MLFGIYAGKLFMEQDNYLNERLEKQIEWYEIKSKYNQTWFKSLRIIEILSAAVIPFVAGYSESIPYSQIIIGSLGVIIAICAGLSSLNKYQENWLTYRTTCETLKHEKYLFLTECKPYQEEDAFKLFVGRVESLISKENSQWSRFTNEKSHNK
jgi:hypothetical protein